MKVLVNGSGNIGTTLACLLIDYKDVLNIEEIHIFKNTPQPWRDTDLDFLKQKGVNVHNSTEIEYTELVTKIDYIFEATSNGVGLKNKSLYEKADNLIGVCAQGSEKDFGLPFMSGINSKPFESIKFIQIVSCNTHGAASILQTICGENLTNLKSADFVVVRRSEDIGNHERLVTSNVIARHLSDDIGTHHAIDVKDMYNSLGVNCDITSSDITTPSQLLHSTRFTIQFKNKISESKFNELILTNSFISTTKKFDSNFIYELGRRYGKYGRIFNHAIVLNNNLLISDKTIKGWAFVPQEGNSIISTIHAFLLQTQPKNADKSIEIIKKELLHPKW
jgi:glyceraldehyde-3-phosphate dehydrogenase (NAD(P))